MSSEPTETDFDPDVISGAVVGTWSFAVTEEPTGIGLLHFTNTGRAIQFIFNPQQQEKRITMRLWYSVESSTHLRFRPNPDHEGWLRDYRFDGSTMKFGAANLSWVCTRPSRDEIPDWFHHSLASALAGT